jgi:predicted GIY-YIG superfamily endonuclease
MDFPIKVGPLNKGRQMLASLSAIKRPDFIQFQGPRCGSCGASLSESITERMDVHGLKYCPICILEKVHPLANPRRLDQLESKEQVRNTILDTYGTPPESSITENEPLPGAYILWCPPLPPDHLSDQMNILQRLKNKYVKVLQATNRNGLIYIGESQDVVSRVWAHLRGEGAILTTCMPPSRLVAVNWKPPEMSLKRLEDQVGYQVIESIEENGYDIEVYWA